MLLYPYRMIYHKPQKGRTAIPMKDKLTLFTKYLLDFMFYSGILVIITLPFSVRFYGRYSTYFAENYYSLCVVLFLSGVFAILIVQQLRRMFRTVIDDDCFIRENVKSLEKMSTYSFLLQSLPRAVSLSSSRPPSLSSSLSL